MQFIAAASLFAAAVSGAAVTTRQETWPVFHVSNFTAQCLPHGGLCFYDFDVIKPNNGETVPVECNVSANGSGKLPTVSDGQCRESSRTFNMTRNDDGSILFMISSQVTPISFTTGSHTIEAYDIMTDGDNQEVYVGDKEFDLMST